MDTKKMKGSAPFIASCVLACRCFDSLTQHMSLFICE